MTIQTNRRVRIAFRKAQNRPPRNSVEPLDTAVVLGKTPGSAIYCSYHEVSNCLTLAVFLIVGMPRCTAFARKGGRISTACDTLEGSHSTTYSSVPDSRSSSVARNERDCQYNQNHRAAGKPQ